MLLTVCTMQAQAGTIYECNGIYTDKPSSECRSHGQTNLPSIGTYTSAKPKPVYRTDTQPATSATPSARPAKKTSSKPLPVRQPSLQQAYKAPQPAGSAAYIAQTGNAKPSNSRRTILEQELSNERKALAQAQADLIRARTLKNGSANPQQISSLQSHVLDRQQNIQALQRELGRM